METAIFVADGVEECEALLVVDLFRRAGIAIQTVAVNDAQGDDEQARTIVSSHDVTIVCDTTIAHVDPAGVKLLIIPGGKQGVENLKASAALSAILKAHGERLAAVCAGPTVLGNLNLLDGHEATVFPGFDSGLGQAHYVDAPVVTDGRATTGRALGASIPFALELIELLRDKDTADGVAKQICFTR